jgi:exopolyphosphatase/guanosine-5'-triphosphate,3'-diphosphate pyrophosphatase
MAHPPRIAVLDVGSNTIKLLIVEKRGSGIFEPLFEEAHACRLGQGISRKRLAAESIERALNSLKYFLLQCRRFDTESIAAVGTAALREAGNADEFLQAAAALGISVEVISGDEEARLSYIAVRNDPHWRDADTLLTVDIGGGSTELAWSTEGANAPQVMSLQMGAVRLTEKAILSDPPEESEVESARNNAWKTLRHAPISALPGALVGVGGTCSNIGSVAAHSAGTPERIHGRKLSVDEIESQIELYGSIPLEQRKRIQGLDPTRADVILAGAVILREVARAAGSDSVEISVRGLRWGLLYDRFESG